MPHANNSECGSITDQNEIIHTIQVTKMLETQEQIQIVKIRCRYDNWKSILLGARRENEKKTHMQMVLSWIVISAC